MGVFASNLPGVQIIINYVLLKRGPKEPSVDVKNRRHTGALMPFQTIKDSNTQSEVNRALKKLCSHLVSGRCVSRKKSFNTLHNEKGSDYSTHIILTIPQ